MKSVTQSFIAVVALLVNSTTSQGQVPAVDGSLDAAIYGPALSIQNTNTQFGNATNGNPQVALNGSEIDQVFAKVIGGRLYVLVTGNLESNFNKLEVFIDSVPGGVNTLNGAALPAGVDGFCCGGFPPPNGSNTNNIGALQKMHGLTFDAGFAADHYLTFSNGTESVGQPQTFFWSVSAYYADLTGGTAGQTAAVGFQSDAFGQEPGLGPGELIDQSNNGWSGPDDPSGSPASHEFAEPVSPLDPSNSRSHRDLLNDVGLLLGVNNSNAAGVAGTGPYTTPTTGNPQDVATGFEFSLPLSQLGNPAGLLKIAAFINGGGHDYASNQFAGVGVLDGNLGGNGFGGFTGDFSGVNLNDFAGDQFVTVIPEPASGVAACAALVGLLPLNRRRARHFWGNGR